MLWKKFSYLKKKNCFLCENCLLQILVFYLKSFFEKMNWWRGLHECRNCSNQDSRMRRMNRMKRFRRKQKKEEIESLFLLLLLFDQNFRQFFSFLRKNSLWKEKKEKKNEKKAFRIIVFGIIAKIKRKKKTSQTLYFYLRICVWASFLCSF